MLPDDKICFCHRVTLRKLAYYAWRERPHSDSQMSACLNAGTGCGSCIPILKKIREYVMARRESLQARPDEPPDLDLEALAECLELPDTAEELAARREEYIRSGRKNTF
jgi:NAD(P)H-nitrite reductase large subunit